MNFTEIANARQSCRKYDPNRTVEQEKLDRILESARLSPSACNGQPYFITVCKSEAAKKVAGLIPSSELFMKDINSSMYFFVSAAAGGV